MITDSRPDDQGRAAASTVCQCPYRPENVVLKSRVCLENMPEFNRNRPPNKKRSKVTTRQKKKDPIFVDGARPRPMYVDYKDLELLTKLTSRQGKLIGRRKSGCTAASQHA